MEGVKHKPGCKKSDPTLNLEPNFDDDDDADDRWQTWIDHEGFESSHHY